MLRNGQTIELEFQSLTTFTNSFLLYFLADAWAQGELCFFFPC